MTENDPTPALTVVDAAIRNMRIFYGPASPAQKTEATTLIASTAESEVVWHRSVLAYSQLVATRVQIDQNALIIRQNQAIGEALAQIGAALGRLSAQQKEGAELVANAVGEAVRISLGLDEGGGAPAAPAPAPAPAKLALVSDTTTEKKPAKKTAEKKPAKKTAEKKPESTEGGEHAKS